VKKKKKQKPLSVWTHADWHSCTRCELHAQCRQKVLGDAGEVEVLFLADMPNSSEHSLGFAGTGPAGKLLTSTFREAQERTNVSVSYGFKHLVACYPRDVDVTELHREACWPRVENDLAEMGPTRVVLLGNEVQAFCKERLPDAVKMVHPNFILRDGERNSPHYMAWIRSMMDLLKEIEDARAVQPERGRDLLDARYLFDL